MGYVRVFVGVCVRVCACACGCARARVCLCTCLRVFHFPGFGSQCPVEKPNVHLHTPELSHVREIPCCKLFLI